MTQGESSGNPFPESRGTTAAELKEFIDSAPLTVGVYDGTPLTQDGVYISPGSASSDETLPLYTGAVELPGERLGAGDSQNGVFFAKITTMTEQGEQVIDVAIKPFTEDPGKAEHEHDALVRAAALGFDAFQPVALVKQGESHFLITALREDISTLDNIDWTTPLSDSRYEREVVPALGFIAKHMGETHGKGLFNGDPQPKNFAKSDTGNPVVMDLESARIAESSDELVELLTGGYEIRDSLAYSDVLQFWYALTHSLGVEHPNCYLPDEPYETVIEEFTLRFLNPYLESLASNLSPSEHDRVNLTDLREGLLRKM